MISLFRNFFQSKIGLPIFIGFLLLVGFAFAMADVSGSAQFGGLSGDDDIAEVGGEEVSSQEMNAAMQGALREAQQQNPTLTMREFVEQGGLDAEIDLFIDRFGTGIFAQNYGLRAGNNLVNSEILKIGAFRNLTGEFDPDVFQAALRRQRITESILRRDIRDGLLAQQLLRPAFAAPQMPEAAARQYAAIILERRTGAIGLVPSAVFAPEGDPSDEQLNTYYSENRSDFVEPERRTIRFARFGADSVDADITPTDAQIAARYEQDAANYAASERRAISSFVVPTEQAARALVARIRAGESLEAVARDAGFNVLSGELRSQAELASVTSPELATQVFAGTEGEVVEPARSTLGFYVARVDDVETRPARTLAQVRGEIAEQLRREARAAALQELSGRIDEMVGSGTSLADIAREFGLEVTSIDGVLEDGRIYGMPGQSFPAPLRSIVSTTFQMEESEPQLHILVPGEQFLIYDVAEITESAAPPLAEVRDEVTAAWRRAEGSRAAGEAAERIREAVEGGASLAQAMRAENSRLTQVNEVTMRRSELASSQQRIPASLVLFFSMAEGTTKVLEEGRDAGHYVIDLESIESDPIEDNPGVVEQTRTTLAPALIGEYNAQLTRAIREEIGVERNEEAIEALRKLLTGET